MTNEEYERILAESNRQVAAYHKVATDYGPNNIDPHPTYAMGQEDGTHAILFIIKQAILTSGTTTGRKVTSMLTTKQQLERTMHTAEAAIFRGEDATGWLWLYELASRKLKELADSKKPAVSATGLSVIKTVFDTNIVSRKVRIAHA